ncbi:MAG: hypothetical protein ACRDAP_13005, partial [Shewanella sp.]
GVKGALFASGSEILTGMDLIEKRPAKKCIFFCKGTWIREVLAPYLPHQRRRRIGLLLFITNRLDCWALNH